MTSNLIELTNCVQLSLCYSITHMFTVRTVTVKEKSQPKADSFRFIVLTYKRVFGLCVCVCV